MKALKLFVASGGDLKEERDKLDLILNKVGKSHPQVKIEPVKWDTDLPSGSVKELRIQDAINKELLDCDIVLVLVYSRFGPYTREEYDLALEKGKKVFVYFKTGFSPKTKKDLSNYGKVLRFKEEIERENRILFKEYQTITEFELLLGDDLNLFITTEYQDGEGTAPGPGVDKKKTRAIALSALPARTVKLVGRDRDLEQLHERLKSGDRVLLVHGMGGAGKTELCIHYLWRYMDEYRYAGWIDYRGSLKESFAGQLRVPGRDLPVEGTVEEQFQRVHRYLSSLDKDMLLLVDNIDNPSDPDMQSLAAYRVKVMANSRCGVEGFSLHEIEFLSEAACKELFYLHYQGEPDPAEVKEVETLIRRAGYHTLAVELLARTARAAGIGVKDLNLKLDQVGFDLDGVIKENIQTQWGNDNAKRSFFQHLARVFDISGLAEEEKRILCNISVMPGLPLEIADLKEWLGMESANVLNGLVEKGWLKRMGNRVEMHAVIGEVVRIKEKPDAVKCRRLIASLERLFYLDPGDNPLEKRDYVAIGEAVANRIKADDRYLASLANNLSLIYKDLGQPKQAKMFQEKALKIREKILDKHHHELAQSYSNLSAIYQDLGQPHRALELQLKDVEITEKIAKADHPDLAVSYDNLSTIYQALGQLELALEYQEKALKIRETVLPKNHPDLAHSYNNLSLIYKDLGQPVRALELKQKGLVIEESFLDKLHPKLAHSYNNLSMIYKDLGQLHRALEFQEKALEIREAVLDKNHPGLATSYNNLSLIYHNLGQLDKALEFQEKAIKIHEVVLDIKNPNLALSYNNLSLIYKDLGQLERALEYQEKALQIQEVVLDKNHPNVALSYNNLSLIYKDLGQLERALEYQEKALQIREAVLDNNHPGLAMSYDNFALIYLELGQPEQALEYVGKALKIREKVLGKHHPDLAASYYNLAMIYLSMGRFEEALEYQEKALRISEKSLPENHPFAAESYINLSLILKSIGRLDEALDYGKKGVEILKKLFPADNPRLKSASEFVELIRGILDKKS